MKHIKNIFLAVMLLFTLSVSAQKGKQLTILHTNDTHSTIQPLKENLADTMKAGRAGFLRRIAMIKEERQKDPELLLFDSGDFSQGSAYYTLFKGDVEIGLMNRMGYDCSTIGNHEFDFGMENMARLFKMANFPIVCSNYDFTGTILEGLVKPYIILRRKGIKIGVFALDPKMEGLVFAKNCQGIKYLDPIEVANEMAFKLKHKEKCDLVICVSHLGWEPITQMGDPMMISHSRNIDIVLGGHSHSYFLKPQVVKDADGKDVPVDQNGKHAIFVGKLVLNME
ncbi:MAG: metallophosphatase [Prevotella sp.]|jgi:5'-nucleotidase|nr:metallophosphatase [Prevotella sp.]